jgi:hypothetical protein
MWARVFEVSLAVWLAIGPFVFGPAASNGHILHDILCATLVLTFALLSFARGLRHIHLLTLGVGAWLVAQGYFGPPEPTPASQNHIITGLLLLMFAVVPSEATQPPQGWRGAAGSGEQ